ncbi:MAG TPA: 50S ribosomal protein L25 [Victivallales bacterium]|nr:50S ribosomal protein L25 [Victivallales bacterium]HPO91821.1 50S ribosomal protein L25 [Victivallales bacterium]HRR28747.1 50S ribosomal protein L25 [Victivallales bacterium]HRU00442.1 50S ribosomal protein L25 [Victivallales bacterium]
MALKSTVIKVLSRSELGTSASRKARRAGKIPCVVYSAGKESKQFYVEDKVWKEIPVSDVHLVELDAPEGKINALVKDVQFDYLRNSTLHIDFQEVRMDQLIEAKVPVHGVGTPIGLSQGGFLEQVLHYITIEALPANIPAAIEVDISGLELDKAIHVSEIKMPEGVKAVTDAHQVVFHVLVPKAEEEIAPAATEGEAAAAAEPELVGGKGKTEEQDAEADSAKTTKESSKEKK